MTANRRDQILLEAARLFSERGVSGATVREIADAAGMLSGSLYHYFPSKDAIVSEILLRFLEDLLKQYSRLGSHGSCRDLLHQLVHVSFQVAADHPYATEIYQNETAIIETLPDYQRIADAVAESHRQWQNVIDLGVRAGEFRTDVSASEFHRMIRELVWMEVRWHRAELEREHARVARNLITVFIDGFGVPASAGEEAPLVHKLGRDLDDLRRVVEELRTRQSDGP